MPILYLFVLLFISACAADREDDLYKDWTPKQFFNEAKNELSAGSLEKSIELFEKLQATYPASRYTKQSRLEVAYAHYDASEYKISLNKFSQFIDLYPDSDKLDYAYYMRGVVSEDQSKSFFSNILIDPAQKNTQGFLQALKYYTQLITKFPESKYSKASAPKLEKIQNYLARHELLVAAFYYKKRAFVATVNRIQGLIVDYPNTNAIPVALKLLEKTYQKLGFREEIIDTSRIFNNNYSHLEIDLNKELGI